MHLPARNHCLHRAGHRPWRCRRRLVRSTAPGGRRAGCCHPGPGDRGGRASPRHLWHRAAAQVPAASTPPPSGAPTCRLPGWRRPAPATARDLRVSDALMRTYGVMGDYYNGYYPAGAWRGYVGANHWARRRWLYDDRTSALQYDLDRYAQAWAAVAYANGSWFWRPTGLRNEQVPSRRRPACGKPRPSRSGCRRSRNRS